MQITPVNYNNQFRNRAFGIGVSPAEYGARLLEEELSKRTQEMSSFATTATTGVSKTQRSEGNLGSNAVSRYMDDLFDGMEYRKQNNK